MAEIPVFRIHNRKMEKDRFEAMAEYLGLRGSLVATEEALFLQDEHRALAYAMPGSRFAGLLFFTDHSQAIGTVVERTPGSDLVESWTREFQNRFQLEPRSFGDDRARISSAIKVLRTESAVEEGEERGRIKRAHLKSDVVSELKVNDHHVSGPRAKIRLVFKQAKGPAWMHHAQWDKLEVFEERPLLSEDEAYRRISDRMAKRSQTARMWRMNEIRLAYFSDEFRGEPDLLLPSYFAEVEFRLPNDKQGERQGPRRLLRLPACR
jgi:hypothetical protein